MTIDIQHGSPQFPAAASAITASAREEMDAALQTLHEHKNAWVAVSIDERIGIVDRLIESFAAIAQRWVAASCKAKGIGEDSPAAGEEWGAGVYPVMKNLRLLRQSLADIKAAGHPRIPGKVKTRLDGQVVAQVFPPNAYDRLLFTGLTAEVWMEPGVTADMLSQTQALAYRQDTRAGAVALVLGAGNQASIGPMDILYKLFVENHVVILKMNPVNAYLGPLIEESFQALIEPDFVRVVYGGALEGAYLCNHELVDEIHITGSDKTFDAIVFGSGAEGAARKANRQSILHKPITGELGNVSPVIVVPGPWSASDLAYQAAHVVSMLTNNAGFNCNATRVIVQQADWPLREQFLREIRQLLGKIPPRSAYYPGAQDRQRSFIADHPDAEQYGAAALDQLPWTLIAGVDAQETDDICFTTEPFCGLFAETALAAADAADFIDRAVSFCNEDVWGTLNVTLLVHPASLKEPRVASAIERATANLRYGTVGINYWAGIGFALCITPWGAFPGHDIADIQSGTGFVHNTLMFGRPQKSVLRGSFRTVPTPPWFVTRASAGRKVFPKLVDLEAAPSPWKVPGLVLAAMGR